MNDMYGKAVGEAMRKALAGKKARQDADEDDRPMQKVTYVRCNTCFGSSEHSRFLFNGARIQSCKCKPGEEEWVKVEVEIPVADPTVKGP